jgi:hypothetical protein
MVDAMGVVGTRPILYVGTNDLHSECSLLGVIGDAVLSNLENFKFVDF